MQFIYMFKVHKNPLTCNLTNRSTTYAKKKLTKRGFWVEDVIWKQKASKRRSSRCLQKRGTMPLQSSYDNAAMNNAKQFTTLSSV